METISAQRMTAMILEAGRQIEEHEQWLSQLDAAIGDGDHGVSMVRGFRAVRRQLEQADRADVGSVLTDTGNMLLKDIGGTCGPLFAVFFLKMAPHAAGKPHIGLREWAAMLTDGLAGVQALGKADVGDKTMVDAMAPAVAYVRAADERNESLESALAGAAEAAEAGAESTVELVARKGRGRYQGQSSSGCRDAGATSAALIFKGFLIGFRREEAAR